MQTRRFAPVFSFLALTALAGLTPALAQEKDSYPGLATLESHRPLTDEGKELVKLLATHSSDKGDRKILASLNTIGGLLATAQAQKLDEKHMKKAAEAIELWGNHVLIKRRLHPSHVPDPKAMERILKGFNPSKDAPKMAALVKNDLDEDELKDSVEVALFALRRVRRDHNFALEYMNKAELESLKEAMGDLKKVQTDVDAIAKRVENFEKLVNSGNDLTKEDLDELEAIKAERDRVITAKKDVETRLKPLLEVERTVAEYLGVKMPAKKD